MVTRVDEALGQQRSTRRGSAGRRFTATDIALVAAFAAFTAVLAVAPPVHLPGNPTPITVQSLGVMLSGAVLGWRRGGAAIALMLIVGALGVPVLWGGRPVLAAFQGPTGGFLIGYVVGAAVIGALVQLRLPRAPVWWIATSCVLGGIGAMYLFGISGMMLRGNLSLPAAATACLALIPGDLLKAAIATAVAATVHRALPGLTPPLRHR